MTQEAEEYWSNFERTTGERVAARAMGQWFETPSLKEGVWGILVLTDHSFHFLGQKAGSWLTGLFGRRGRQDAQPVTFVVPRDSFLALKCPRPGFLGRLFGPAFPRITLSWRMPGDAAARESVFEVDDESGFIKALQEAVPGSGEDEEGK